jgi:hypothetical protein
MLGVSNYPQDYVDACRARAQSQIEAYDALVAATRTASGERSGEVDAAFDSFEPVFYNNMVLTLDSSFVHRLRGKEGKDGNPLNEVRVLCNSLLQGKGVFSPEKAIKLEPDTSILGYAEGDEIGVRAAGFARLSEAFFAELERRFV